MSSNLKYIELLVYSYPCCPWISLENFNRLFLQIFSPSISVSSFFFFWSLTMCVLVHLIVSQRLLRLHLLSFNLFSFCCSASNVSIVQSCRLLVLHSTCSNLPLNQSSKFLIVVFVLLSTRIWGEGSMFSDISIFFTHPVVTSP